MGVMLRSGFLPFAENSGWRDSWQDGWRDSWQNGWRDSWQDGWRDGWRGRVPRSSGHARGSGEDGPRCDSILRPFALLG
ncbi:hypothetical protein B5G20_03695 [Collinsella sp. An7]|nr:hypothetical protein B5G20_03695 [Collinsella sp. An7]